MTEIEKPASFYIGKITDPQTGVRSTPLQYDARDLTTHAVCLGMTGSGKTGLCIDLLEEAALDGIPSIIIDPKGDITNMLLTFPDLAPADFLPWINPDDAERAGLTPAAYAEQVARQWSEGLAAWGEGPERIRRLKQAAEFVVYTPGSDAGARVSILQTLAAPALSWDDEEETLREKIASTAAALLELAGVSSEALRSRSQVLLVNLFERAWRAGEDLDLAKLILQIQKPPMRKLGVFDMDAYFSPDQRMALALALHDIIAAPTFEHWIEGAPLDIAQIVRAGDGRPRVAIFYIAHLSEAERSFFVTLLLEQVLAWTRTLSGTSSLRTILYFDEVFGYFPPHPADPPTKKPLLTLLKQARAVGLGVVLVTQNPVDLDYKGLTNAGTWFIGKLQTDRDKARLLEGLEGVAVQEGGAFDRAYFDRLIGGLKPRTFILHNVHAPAPVVFTSRWALSYLRGPLTRSQVRELSRPQGGALDRPEKAPEPGAAPRAAGDAERPTWESAPPSLPVEVPQYYLPVTDPPEQVIRQSRGKVSLLYRPAVLGLATVRYVHAPSAIDMRQQLAYILWPERIAAIPDWSAAEQVPLEKRDLGSQAYRAARFGDVPAALSSAARLKALEKSFLGHLLRDRWLVVTQNPSLKLYARPAETEGDFQARCREIAGQRRSAEAEKIRAKYTARIERIQERIRREDQELQEDRVEYDGRKREEMISAGESVLGLFTGRRSTRAFSTASRKRRLTSQAREEIAESEVMIDELKRQMAQLQTALDAELADADARGAQAQADVRAVHVAPRRGDVALEAFGLVWVPLWEAEILDERGEKGRQVLPAYNKAGKPCEGCQPSQGLPA